MITSPGEDGEDMKIKWNTGSVRTGFDFCLQIASRESRLQHDMDSNKDDKAVLYTHTHQKCPCIQGYPGISRASNLLNPRSELRTGWCAQHKESTESTFFADRHKTAEHLHRTLEPRANDTISQSPWQVLQTFYDSTRFMHRLRILNDLNEDN